MPKIDLDKLIGSLFKAGRCEYSALKAIQEALGDQGLVCVDGEMRDANASKLFNKERLIEVAVPESEFEKAEAENRRNFRERYGRIAESDWFKKNHHDMSVSDDEDEKEPGLTEFEELLDQMCREVMAFKKFIDIVPTVKRYSPQLIELARQEILGKVTQWDVDNLVHEFKNGTSVNNQRVADIYRKGINDVLEKLEG